LHSPWATFARATISATRAVRSIISRWAVVRMRSSVSIAVSGPAARARRDREHLRRRVLLARDADRHTALVLEGREQKILVHPAGEPRPRDRRRRLAIERGRVAVDVPVRLQVDRAAAHADLDRLVDELARSADRHEREQALDVLRAETHAAVAHLHPDPPGDVGPVDAVERQGGPEAGPAQRGVGGAPGGGPARGAP